MHVLTDMKVTGLGEDGFGPGSCTDKLAARICGQAEPDQILAPIVVRELAAGKQ